MSTVVITFQRDSVCMGDDCNAPHYYSFSMLGENTIMDLFSHLANKNYLAKVAGQHHRWSCLMEGKEIATFIGNNNIPESDSFHNSLLSELAQKGKINGRFIYHRSAT